MVEVGTLSIKGSIDITTIEQGIKRIEKKLDSLRGKQASSTSDFIRMERAVSATGKAFAGLGAAAFTSIFALAKDSPALAQNMADIELAAFELGMIFGEELEPEVRRVAELFTKFTLAMQQNPPLRSLIVDAAILGGAAGLGLVLTKLTGIKALGVITVGITYLIKRQDIKEGLEENLGKTGGDIVSAGLDIGVGATVGGAVGGPGGAVVGGIVGSLIAIDSKLKDDYDSNLLEFINSMFIFGNKTEKGNILLQRLSGSERTSGIIGTRV